MNSSTNRTGTESPRVLVSVLAYGNVEQTLETIACFRRQTYPDLHLQVIDNASPRPLASEIAKHFPDLEVIRLEKNGGYTAGNNAALDRGLAERFDYVLISNHDVVVPSSLVSHLVESAETHPECGVMGVIEEDFATGRIKAIGGKNFRFWKARGEWISKVPSSNTNVLEVECVQGAVVMFSRKALEAGIRLDEKLFMYCEEFDLSFQLKRRKLRAYTDLRCRVRHKISHEYLSVFQGYLLQRNRLYLCRKHGSISHFVLSLAYSILFELPIKALVRGLQGNPRYARACLAGFSDALRGKMGIPTLSIFDAPPSRRPSPLKGEGVPIRFL